MRVPLSERAGVVITLVINPAPFKPYKGPWGA
jgi:hypothetical protein